jgi:hypothetical protein
MKKKFTLLLFLVSCTFFGQQKTTGVLNLNANMTTKLDLDQASSTATLTITNLANSWFGLGFSTTAITSGTGMPPLVDCVVMRSDTNLSDSRTRVANINGNGNGNPDIDAIQNWTIVSNDVSGTIRTLIATRPFDTGDANDIVFNYADSSINLIYASPGSGIFTLGYHGVAPNRGSLNAPLTALGVEDFSLNASAVFPNPSSGSFTVRSKIDIESIAIYSQTGAFIKTVKVDNTDRTEINVGGLSTGIYLIELKNKDDKSWKKVIIE